MSYFQYAIGDWCFRLFGAKFDTNALCSVARELDAYLDLVPVSEWEKVQEAGIGLCSVLPDMGVDRAGMPTPPFAPGFNDPESAERVYANIDAAIENAYAREIKRVLTFTGMDTGAPRDDQFQAIVDGYTKNRGSAAESLVKKAERLGVTLVIEMLNTRGDPETWKGHPGYLGNNTAELIDKVIRPVGSPNFKLAFDVYHVQMMSENPFEMIQRFHEFIGMIHVAGVMEQAEGHHPQNRGELTLGDQKVEYASVCGALAKHLPEGFPVLLEYIPTRTDPMEVKADLASAIELCESMIPQNAAA